MGKEFGETFVIDGPDRWYEPLIGETILCQLEFSVINGEKILFHAIPTEVPSCLKQHKGRPILPQHIIIV